MGSRLVGFYLAYSRYGIVGWWFYLQKHGSIRGGLPRSAGEMAPWGVAVAMMQAAPSAYGGQAGVHLALVGMGVGLAVGGPIDGFGLTKDLQRLAGRTG